MWEIIVDFFTAETWWMLIVIMVVKIVEVSLSTLRVILINKGFRKIGTIIAFIGICIWICIAAFVLNDLMAVPIRGIFYAIGFTIGVWIGSIVEEKLAFGTIFVQIITAKENGEDITLVNELRKNHYGATTINAHGKDADKTVIMVITHRKNTDLLINLVNLNSPKSIITTNEVKNMKGGFLTSYKDTRKLIK